MSDCNDALRGTAACDGCKGCDAQPAKELSYVRHKGWFEISEDLVYSRDQTVGMIFGNIRVYCAEKDEFRGTVRYVGVSPMFEELGFGEAIPEYIIEITDDGVRATKVTE